MADNFDTNVGFSGIQNGGEIELATVKKITMKDPSKPQVPVDLTKLSLYEQRKLRAKATVEYYAESPFFVGLMSAYTLWALYNDDIRLSSTGKEADDAFEIVISLGLFLFVLEICASCFYKPDYWTQPVWTRIGDETFYESVVRRMQIGSFYFWLDIIATLSLVLEVRVVQIMC